MTFGELLSSLLTDTELSQVQAASNALGGAFSVGN